MTLAAALYALTAAGHLQTGDFRSELAVAQSLTAGSLQVRPYPGPDYVPSVLGLHGRRYSKYGLGESVLLLPAALAGRLTGCPPDPTGCPARAHRLVDVVASFENGALTAFAVGLLFLLAVDLGAGLGAALALSLLLGFASIQWAYAHDGFDVGPAAAFILATMLALHRAVDRPGRTWPLLAGSALGFAVLLRIADAVIAPVAVAYLLAALWADRGRALRSVAWFSLGVAAFLLLIGLYDLVRFGSPIELGYRLAADDQHFGSPLGGGLAGLLFSPGKSLFLFSPVLVAALIGWPAFLRRHLLFSLLIAAVCLETLLLHASYGVWSGDWAWGPRYMVLVTPLLLLPLLSILDRWRELAGWVRALLVALFALSGVVAALGVLVDFGHQMVIEVLSGHDLSKGYWIPAQSAIWIHLAAIGQIVAGHAPYSEYNRASDVAAGLPPGTTIDFWWAYALLGGANPFPVLAVVAGLLLVAFWMARDLRRALPKPDV